MRRCDVRRQGNFLKRWIAQVSAFNLTLLMCMHLSTGTPQNRIHAHFRWRMGLCSDDNLKESGTLFETTLQIQTFPDEHADAIQKSEPLHH